MVASAVSDGRSPRGRAPRLIGFLERAIRLIQASSRLPLQAQGRLELPDFLIRQASQS